MRRLRGEETWTVNRDNYKVPCYGSKENELCGGLRIDTGQKKLRMKALMVHLHVGSLQMLGEIQCAGERRKHHI